MAIYIRPIRAVLTASSDARPVAARRSFRHLVKVFSDTSGASAVEYGLLAGLVAVGLAGGLGELASLVAQLFDIVVEEVSSATDALVG